MATTIDTDLLKLNSKCIYCCKNPSVDGKSGCQACYDIQKARRDSKEESSICGQCNTKKIWRKSKTTCESCKKSNFESLGLLKN